MTPTAPPAAHAAPQRFHTLRLSLILPFVALVALLTGALGMVWYWTGSKTVSALSHELMTEMVQRTSLAVQQHVQRAGTALEVAFPAGLPAGPDIALELPALRQRLWAATSLSQEGGDYVHYGNQAGQNVGMLRLSREQAELRLKTDAAQHRTRYLLRGIAGEPVWQSTEPGLFDPRTRPWFEDARQAQQAVWTPVYIDFNARDLVVTRARRVLSPSGAFEGVVATDLFLNALQQFVARLPIAGGTRAMIIEPSGALIAASNLPVIRLDGSGRPERIQADTSGDPLLAAIYRHLQTTAGADHADSHAPLLIETEGRAIQVAFRRLGDDAGLNWTVAVAVPHNDMLAGLRRDLVLAIALGLLALGLTTAIGLRIFGGVAKDMRTLTHAVRRVGQGEIDTPIALRRKDEIGELAHNFHHMRHNLFTDPLTGVSNRSALQHILATLTRPEPAGQPPAPFALMFIDLNRFKPLNDRWGHDNGDLALQEVAQRLRSHLRASDMLARLGGDEFVAVLQGIGQDAQARATCEQLQAVIAPPLTRLQGVPEGEQVCVGASIGYALYPRDGRDAASLLKHADQDMYRHKDPGAIR